MTASPDEVSARRSEWRADLLDYHADVLTAGGIDATDKREAAELYRLAATLTRELEAASAGDRDAYYAKQVEVAEVRARWREIGDFAGTRGTGVVNNFSEPSDEELAQ